MLCSQAIREYQNTHRAQDLDPIWILKNANRSFICEPGECGRYSSLNYVLLGLVLAQASGVPNWDMLDQRAWHGGSEFTGMFYGVHGPMQNFSTATGRVSGSVSGYQYARYHHQLPSAQADVSNMSSTQGWTCGNLVTTPAQVAAFFWDLLGPGQTLLMPSTLQQMLQFYSCQYFGGNGTCNKNARGSFGYGLGLMNFTSMDWGFEEQGLYYGHNGLTYGFGSQSGFNYPLQFSASWVNNVEVWIGHDRWGQPGPNALYTRLCEVVRQYR